MGEASECESPEQACIDYSYFDVGEVEFFTDHRTCGPVVESTHIDEQVERCVAEQYAMPPASELGLILLRNGSHRCTVSRFLFECVSEKLRYVNCWHECRSSRASEWRFRMLVERLWVMTEVFKVVRLGPTPQSSRYQREEVDDRHVVVSGVPFASIEKYVGRSMLEITDQ